jgi:hypothetical protein
MAETTRVANFKSGMENSSIMRAIFSYSLVSTIYAGMISGIMGELKGVVLGALLLYVISMCQNVGTIMMPFIKLDEKMGAFTGIVMHSLGDVAIILYIFGVIDAMTMLITVSIADIIGGILCAQFTYEMAFPMNVQLGKFAGDTFMVKGSIMSALGILSMGIAVLALNVVSKEVVMGIATVINLTSSWYFWKIYKVYVDGKASGDVQ